MVNQKVKVKVKPKIKVSIKHTVVDGLILKQVKKI